MITAGRYWLFGGAQYYACGGMNDTIGRFGALSDAIAYAKAWEDPWSDRDWWHIVDTLTGELVAESEMRPYGAPERRAENQ